MPQFNVGDEIEYIGPSAAECARGYSPNGRSYVIIRIQEPLPDMDHARRLYFIDKRGHANFFYEDEDVRLVRHTGPPENTRDMSYLILQKLENS